MEHSAIAIRDNAPVENAEQLVCEKAVENATRPVKLSQPRDEAKLAVARGQTI